MPTSVPTLFKNIIDGLEFFERGLQVLHDLRRDDVRFGEAGAVLQGFVPQPEDIQVGRRSSNLSQAHASRGSYRSKLSVLETSTEQKEEPPPQKCVRVTGERSRALPR